MFSNLIRRYSSRYRVHCRSAFLGNLRWSLKPHDASVSCIRYSKDGRWLVTGSHDNTLKVGRVLPPVPLAPVASRPLRVCFLRCGLLYLGPLVGSCCARGVRGRRPSSPPSPPPSSPSPSDTSSSLPLTMTSSSVSTRGQHSMLHGRC